MTKPGEDKYKRTLFAVFAVFTIMVSVCYAMYFNAMGPDAPVMMKFFGTDNTMQGFLVTLEAAAAIAVSFILALFAERFNKITIQLIGIILIALAALNIAMIPAYMQQGNGYGLLICFVMVGGVGMSVTNVMNSSILSDVYPNKNKIFVPVMQGVYGAACMVIPVIVNGTADENAPSTFGNPYLFVAVLAIVVTVIFAVTGHKIKKYTIYADLGKISTRAKENPAEIYRQPGAWVIFIAGFLYFVFQIGLVTWFPTFSINDLGIDYSMSGYFNTAFFAGQLVMRFLLVPLLKKISPERCYVTFGAIGVACMIFAMMMPSAPAMMAMLAVGGFFQGGSAPLLTIMILDRFPERSASSCAMIDLSVNLATLTGPIVMGAMADANGGSFRYAMYLLIASLAVSVVIIGINKLTENRRKAETK